MVHRTPENRESLGPRSRGVCRGEPRDMSDLDLVGAGFCILEMTALRNEITKITMDGKGQEECGVLRMRCVFKGFIISSKNQVPSATTRLSGDAMLSCSIYPVSCVSLFLLFGCFGSRQPLLLWLAALKCFYILPNRQTLFSVGFSQETALPQRSLLFLAVFFPLHAPVAPRYPLPFSFLTFCSASFIHIRLPPQDFLLVGSPNGRDIIRIALETLYFFVYLLTFSYFSLHRINEAIFCFVFFVCPFFSSCVDMPHRQMKDPQEKHVVSKKPLQNSMNQQSPTCQKLEICEVSMQDVKKTIGRRRGRGRANGARMEKTSEATVENLDVGPPVSSKGIRFLQRPGYGQAGTKCIVKANHFLAELPDKDLIQYDVSIIPEVASRSVNRAIMAELIKLYRETDLGMRLPAYDGRRSLYTAGLLPFNSKEFYIKIVDEDEGIAIPRREREFKVTIKFAARADLHHLRQFLSGKQVDAPHEALQVLDIVMRELASQRYVSVGRSFFSPDIRKPQRLGDGLQSWCGFYQSIRPTQMGLSLNIDMSSTAFIEPLPVIEFVAQILGKDVSSRPLSDSDRVKVKKALRGVKVEVTHRGNVRRKYRISGLTSQPTRELIFPVDDQMNMKSVVEYFQEMYGFTIRYPHLPCLQVGNQKKANYLPMEACKIVEGQRYTKRLNEKQITSLLKVTCQRPKEQEMDILQTVHQNAYSEDPYAKEFGINISDKLASVEARVLPAPWLKYHDTGKEKDCLPQVGQWNMMNKKMINGSTVNYWACINFSRSVQESTARGFCQELAQMCQVSGMEFSREPVIPIYSARPDQVEKALKYVYNASMNKLKGKELELLLAILPDNNGSLYGDLKRICETDLGLISQCCLTKHVFRISKQYLANVSLKINVKMGGRNTVLLDALSWRIPLVSDIPTIIFGADVTHPETGEESSPSIAAVVASQDWPEVTKYAGLVCAQAHRQELIQDLFKTWHDPQRGTVTGGMIRDGVSEGQFYQVLLYELDAIRKVQTKLPAASNLCGGTVVDSRICHPTEFDFYLCSHAGIQGPITYGLDYGLKPLALEDLGEKGCDFLSLAIRDWFNLVLFGLTLGSDFLSFAIRDWFNLGLNLVKPFESGVSWADFVWKGTSRPAHYHVLWDENNFTADEMQSLTNNLCYTYARCTRSVSVAVPPAYYAHLAAFRARFYMEPDLPDNTTSRNTCATNGNGACVRQLPALKEKVKRGSTSQFYLLSQSMVFPPSKCLVGGGGAGMKKTILGNVSFPGFIYSTRNFVWLLGHRFSVSERQDAGAFLGGPGLKVEFGTFVRIEPLLLLLACSFNCPYLHLHEQSITGLKPPEKFLITNTCNAAAGGFDPYYRWQLVNAVWGKAPDATSINHPPTVHCWYSILPNSKASLSHTRPRAHTASASLSHIHTAGTLYSLTARPLSLSLSEWPVTGETTWLAPNILQRCPVQVKNSSPSLPLPLGLKISIQDDRFSVILRDRRGVCMMSNAWKEDQHPSFIDFISSFLAANSYRLNFLPITPDFIFNNGGMSVAFVFIKNWGCNNASSIFSRILNLKKQFQHLYVVVTLPTVECNDSFIRSYFKYGMELGRPTFVPVQDLEMGFEKIVKIAHACGECKRLDVIPKLKEELKSFGVLFLKRKQLVQRIDTLVKMVTSIPGIDHHDANMLIQAIGSIEAISKASKGCILENTDLSVEKAETIVRFFRDSKYYLSSKIN
ncbi:hypothetical protein ACLOJK_031909 [Asimina triloba]